jgi:hypothetical protein
MNEDKDDQLKIDKIDKCQNTILELNEKYKDNKYMLKSIYNHTVNYLPKILENELKTHEKRVDRNNYLTNEQQLFIQNFLNKNQYYYLSNNNCYYEYDGINYFIVKDDDIIHKLLSSISKDRILLQRKYQTKINIFKQIKDRNLFHSTPKIETIENVLNNLSPLIFSTKDEVKYFLTIIGDNIFKKSSNIFLISSKMKAFILELDIIACNFIGNNTFNNFMTKYHENHSFQNCRLLKINENYSNEDWIIFLKKYSLELLCVSTYYSKLYESSDIFLKVENDLDLPFLKYVNYLKNISQEEIVNNFCTKCILIGVNKIEWKFLYIKWKQYLSSFSLPNIIYSNILKENLKNKYNFDEITDSFTNIQLLDII